MSGSDIGFDGGGGVGGGPTPASCETLVIMSQLTSPKADIIEKIRVGETLDVALNQQGQQIVVVVLRGTEIVGGLAPLAVSQLRECLQGGYKYEAKVVSISEGQVRVKVQYKSA